MATMFIRVSGMTCAHCQATVEKALRAVPGVLAAVCSLRGGSVEVDFEDDRVTAAELTEAVKRSGYGGELLP